MLASLTLVGAGLIVRSLLITSAQPLGLDPHDRVVVELTAPAAKYPTETAQVHAMFDLERRLAAMHGVAAIRGEREAREPELHAAVMRVVAAWGTPGGPEVFHTEYEKAEKVSIDYAVMQDAAKAGKVLVMHAPYQWDDVGSWLALERHNPQDADGNTVQGLHAVVDTKNCVVVADSDHLIGTLGVNDLVVIQSGNATLITTRKGEAEVKKLVDKIKEKGLGRFL